MSAHHCCSTWGPLWYPFTLALGCSNPLQQRWASTANYTLAHSVGPWNGGKGAAGRKRNLCQFLVQMPPNQFNEERLQSSVHLSLQASKAIWDALQYSPWLLDAASGCPTGRGPCLSDLWECFCYSWGISNVPNAYAWRESIKFSISMITPLTQNNDIYYLYAPLTPLVLQLRTFTKISVSMCQEFCTKLMRNSPWPKRMAGGEKQHALPKLTQVICCRKSTTNSHPQNTENSNTVQTLLL